MGTSRYLKILVISLLIVVVWVLAVWLKFLYTPIVSDVHGMKYVVREGSSMHTIIQDLYDLKVVKHPRLFKLLVRMKGVSGQLKAGEYLFPKGSTPSSMLRQIITGTGMIYHSFMIVPGWTFHEVINSLHRNPNFHNTTQNLTDEEIMARLGAPKEKPEGKFFPDTYFFVEGTDDIVILKRAYKTMNKKLNTAWRGREPGLPFKTPYEALIAASIIEKEFYFHEELPKIAGVLVNRLRKGMLLQFDPTVIYGMGSSYDGKIRHSDLLSDNPYNTYVHKGLPPTPISMPSLGAIAAVLHPMKHDYYYFVAQQVGSHQFSKNLTEHYKAVQQAKKSQWFFNYTLTRYYLLKLFTQKMYSLN